MNKNQMKILLLLLLLAAAMPLCAQTGGDVLPAGMQSLADKVLKIFTGGFVKTILIICLAGCAVAYGFNKDNEKMKRNIIAIAVAIGIIVASTEIVNQVWTAAGTT